jgi:low temperature requirement protein LtrA
VVRLIGLALYWVGVREDPRQRAALRTYLPAALLGPALVLAGGLLDGDARLVLWALAVAVDVGSAVAAGRGEFRMDAPHFAERHGLIVIIALGESVVAIGATAAGIGLSRDVVALVAVAFTAVAALWWCYFDWVGAAAEARLAAEADHRRQGRLARDLYTFGHLPIVAGTVVLAAAVEEALLHPTDPLEGFAVTALALGPALYLAGFVAGNLRATGRILPIRVAGIVGVLVVALVLGPRVAALATMAGVAAVLTAVGVVETLQRRAPAAAAAAPR